MTVLFGEVDHGLAGWGHLAGGDELFDAGFVEFTPNAFGFARAVPLHVGVGVDGAKGGVDPAETEGFFDGVGVGEAVFVGGLFVEDEPDAGGFGVVFGEPGAPGFPGFGVELFEV